MKLYSTNDSSNVVDLKEAVMQSLPRDRGLYMPTVVPQIKAEWYSELDQLSITDIAYHICRSLIGDYIPAADMRGIVDRAINFEAPLVQLDDDMASLELWHGPSLAFKDFGARFMAQLMAYFNRGDDRPLTILVATSGDTGGAVAAGFHNTPGIEVIILYPKGKVSHLQEQQLTTLGGNVTALEIEGTFDDCQALVKSAFVDDTLAGQYRLSSANSINIARLIPQSFYYVDAYRQVQDKSKQVVVAVPSGNFGNLTAGLLACRMGCPLHHFIAATNANDVVPRYLRSGNYSPRPSIATISNAMDVGSPSNFTRMLALFDGDHKAMATAISGYALDDDGTGVAMSDIYKQYGYIADPHGAIGFAALQQYMSTAQGATGIVLETAHPAKFLDVMTAKLPAANVAIPAALQAVAAKQKVAVELSTSYDSFRDWLASRS